MSGPIDMDLVDPGELGEQWRLVRLAIDHAAIANQLVSGIAPSTRHKTLLDGKWYPVADVIALAQVHATISAAMAQLESALHTSGSG